MEVSAKIIAEHLGGEIVGNPDATVSSVARIESGKPGTLCFLANPKYEQYLYTCKASIILINKSFEPKEPVQATLVKVDNAYEAIASLLDLLNTMKSARRRGRAWSAHVAFSARLGKGVYVGSNAYVGRKAVIGSGTQIYPMVYIGDGVTVGDNCILYPGVKIYKGCRIGNNCIIQSNAVIGSDGFGFAPTADGSYKKIPQTGIVTIEDDCEIGANTVIDRSTMGTTLIEKGVKLDNLIQVAHNVTIGANTVIAAQTGIAGSTKVGRSCMFGGQVGIAGHLHIADGTRLAAQAGVLGDIKEEGKAYMGSPAIEHMNFIRSYAVFRRSGKK
ncbi:MAG TPA: UDP-3-O-(3-hydroxymyristoyl)glucosamine N-acyltransferase [Candidatus Coprenecus stercoravium]|uniref:UDP-3-O-acylglucosamine N-acyltransferase n=1 Tax=Candidatus Coprenecus stercoravium TaxID=2840735 RepID=A0A9D2GQV5_9BACT|nr:UDP-3-O-(3-hydroxymyristoyl)glucosamine N-acyltransferase [Candidatus Coprenecus stercoravium]